MAIYTIRELLQQVPTGQIRIPAFQRGFVWDPDMVAFLMDSIYKGYPIGSLLFWRTREQLRHERKLGPFSLPERDPDYPIDYVLDGQQRITSIFGVFQTDLEPDPSVEWADIYFDLNADPSLQESQFAALKPDAVEERRHFPLNSLFATVAYRRATENLGDPDLETIDDMQSRFKEARVPVEVLPTEDRAKVAIVFERINRTGVPLDTLQLLTAWTWSEDFDLQNEFEEFRDELAPFGFEQVGEDSNLLLRCCAGVLAGDAAPATLVSLRGNEVRERFDEILNGVRGAIDFLKNNLHVQSLENLPFSTVLVPLSVFFSAPGDTHFQMKDAQRKRIERWFWRSNFSRRYSSGVLRNLKEDIQQIQLLKNGNGSSLGDFPSAIGPDFFLNNAFRINSVNTKTFVLLLAQQTPHNFISGAEVPLGSVLRPFNRSEFHHMYPRAYLRETGVSTDAQNRLVNFCFLSKVDNTRLGGVAPSEYRERMPGEIEAILKHSLCPDSLFGDDFDRFCRERADLLSQTANAPWNRVAIQRALSGTRF